MSLPAQDSANPKDLAGACKVDLSLIPPAAEIHLAHALADGDRKYGAYNWREKKVRGRVYIGAARRHLLSFLDGEDIAGDSGVHHLGHVMACCAIILDAQGTGNLIDDRPVKGPASNLLAELQKQNLAREEAFRLETSPQVDTTRIKAQLDSPLEVGDRVEITTTSDPRAVGRLGHVRGGADELGRYYVTFGSGYGPSSGFFTAGQLRKIPRE